MNKEEKITYYLKVILVVAAFILAFLFIFNEIVFGQDFGKIIGEDDRFPSNVQAVGRTTFGSAVLIHGGVYIDASHVINCEGCWVEHVVPFSDDNGNLNEGAYKFYVIEETMIEVGKEIRIFETEPNQATGYSAGIEIGQFLRIKRFDDPDQIQVCGYGEAEGKFNRTQQTATGAVNWIDFHNGEIHHLADTKEGCSGGAVWAFDNIEYLIGIESAQAVTVDINITQMLDYQLNSETNALDSIHFAVQKLVAADKYPKAIFIDLGHLDATDDWQEYDAGRIYRPMVDMSFAVQKAEKFYTEDNQGSTLLPVPGSYFTEQKFFDGKAAGMIIKPTIGPVWVNGNLVPIPKKPITKSENKVAKTYKLAQINPNPSNGEFRIIYELTKPANFSMLKVYNSVGQEVDRMYITVIQGVGRNMVKWRPKNNIASGTYFIQVVAGSPKVGEPQIIYGRLTYLK